MRNKYLLTVGMILSLLGGYVVNTVAQERIPAATCGAEKARESYYKSHPEERLIEEESIKQTQEFIKKMKFKKSAKEDSYTMPVVFHVFGTDFVGKKVTEETVKIALEKANDDFNARNDDYDDVDDLFKPLRQKLDITFKLAQIDPDGNPTTGITFHDAEGGFGNGNADALVQKYAWDNYKYMNVYITLDLYADGGLYNSGVAWYPSTSMSDSNLARVVYNGRYLHGNTGKEFASVLTHEFGHWLDLRHTFNGGCGEPNRSDNGDLIADTPPTTSNSGSCNISEEKCPNAGIPNGENYMDYSQCYRMFTQGQVDRMVAALNKKSRKSLWQQSNLVATGVTGALGPHLAYGSINFHEDDVNAGVIEKSIEITAKEGASFAKLGNLLSGTDFTSRNIPNGLTLGINVTSNTIATVTLSGSASSNEVVNSVENMEIEFFNSAITGGVSAILNPIRTKLQVTFMDPYSIVYGDPRDVITNSTSSFWVYTLVGEGVEKYGTWFDNGKLRIETYQNDLVATSETRDITYIDFGTQINSSMNWVAGGKYPDEHNLRTDDYTVWEGREGYLAFRFKNTRGKLLYGWMRITVNADGTEFSLLDYAFNEKPDTPIYAGSKDESAPEILASFQANQLKTSTKGEVIFSNNSKTKPGTTITSWNWTFEGGTPNSYIGSNPPAVKYAVEGTYSVTLSVANNDGKTDVLENEDYITISDTYCGPTTSYGTYSYISNVKFGTIDRTSGETSYSNNLKSAVIEATKGSSYNLEITTNVGNSSATDNHAIKVWADWNGDYVISSDELISTTSYEVGDLGEEKEFKYQTTVTIPTNAASELIALRISVQHIDANSTDDPCGNIDSGEWEDYGINLSGELLPPVAKFSQDNATIKRGESVQFTDESTNSPTSWLWTFQGADIETSTEQNPLVRFDDKPGSYFVTLKATNSAGISTNNVYGFVTIEEGPNAPISIFSAVKKRVEENETVQFLDESTNTPTEWNWFFPGGTPDKSSEQNPTVTYAESGTYFVGLRVFNNDGQDYSFTDEYIIVDEAGGNIPVANFTASTTNLNEGETVSFTDGSTHSPTSWNWTFEGGTPATSTVENPTVTYSTAGTYSVTLRVTNVDGSNSTTKTSFITVNADLNPPIAALSANSTSINEGGSVQFTDGSTNSPTSWSWTFNGGSPSTSTAQNPSVSYSTAGTYAVSLTATNADGSNSITKSAFITVSRIPTPPVASFNSDNTSIEEGESVQFTDGSTNSPTSWSWAFEGGSPATSSVENPSVSYSGVGTYTVSLTVANADGSNSITSSSYITVNEIQNPGNETPTYCEGTVRSSYNPIERVQLNTIDNSSDFGSNGYEDFRSISTNLSVGTSYDVTVTNKISYWSGIDVQVWIDWNINGQFEANERVYHKRGTGIYSGTFTVPSTAVSGNTGMRVRTAYGKSPDACGYDNYMGEVEDYTVAIGGGGQQLPAPTADFTANATVVNEGASVSFSDTSSDLPTSWSWTFEGGTPATSTVENPSVSYSTPGTYSVSLTSSNVNGSDAITKSEFITVNRIPRAPIANLSANVTTIEEGGSVQFTDESTNSPSSWSWTFEGGSPASSTAQNPNVTYSTAGNYAVSLTVTNGDGSNSTTRSSFITVNEITTGGEAPVYCEASVNNAYNPVVRVQMGSIDNASGFGTNGYQNFANQGTTVTSGSSYTVSITNQISYWPKIDVQVWIDWNRNGEFEASERVYHKRGSGIFSGEFTVPQNAISGTTGMRVRTAYGRTPLPCGNDNYMGEIEDYSVTISGGAGDQASFEPVISDERELTIYPNPSKGWTNINIDGLSENAFIKIVNLQGQTIYENSYSRVINLSNQPKGMYSVMVIDSAKIFNKSLIIQ